MMQLLRRFLLLCQPRESHLCSDAYQRRRPSPLANVEDGRTGAGARRSRQETAPTAPPVRRPHQEPAPTAPPAPTTPTASTAPTSPTAPYAPTSPRSSPPPTTSMSGKKEGPHPPELCQSCHDKVPEEDPGSLRCQSGHILCGECSAVYVDSVLGAGPAAVSPAPKCTICRAPIPVTPFERLLNPDQLSTYLTYVAMLTLQPGESVVSCVNCSYCEVRTDEPPIFWCRSDACATVHCVGCKAKLPLVSDRVLFGEDATNSDEEKALLEGQDALERHLLCSALRVEKAAFDDAVSSGNGMACPGCGVVGRKDGMCTHMTCEGCATDWCYLCGLSLDDCDKAPTTELASIYDHNLDWKQNPKRCPMYITAIAEIDDEWDLTGDAEDSDGEYEQDRLEELCLDKFHKWQTIQKLKALRDNLGEEKWKELQNTFASVKNCGFSDHEIAEAGDTPLFTRLDVQVAS